MFLNPPLPFAIALSHTSLFLLERAWIKIKPKFFRHRIPTSTIKTQASAGHQAQSGDKAKVCKSSE
jgi:hypothetical protein